MQVKHYIYLLFIIAFGSSCLERYWPDVDKYDELLVVDGLISDAPGPYQVKLSLSSNLDELIYNPLPNAVVTIEDDLGNLIHLSESGKGNYETPAEFQAATGRSYRLLVQTPEGGDYETEFQQLKEAPEIDSLYADAEIRDTRNPDQPIGGYQFFVDVKPENNEEGFYFWRMEEAYMYRSAFYINYIYDGTMREMFNTDSVYLCYGQGKRSEIYTYDTKNLTDKNIDQLPLTFVSNQTPRLSMRYCLLVKQYFISEEAYHYWNGIEKQRGDQGSLYSKQPYQIAGNLKNKSNPEEPVLGFFIVGGVKEKKIFVSRPAGVPIFIFTCAPDEDLIGYLADIPESEYPVYFFLTAAGAFASSSDYCFDCTLRGGSLEKPDFWDD